MTKKSTTLLCCVFFMNAVNVRAIHKRQKRSGGIFMTKKILIANRGEIVNRIIRTCKKMGIETVVVYSEADKAANYVEKAMESYNIGAATPVKRLC